MPGHAHPVKVERHDVRALQHVTNTGTRAVRTYTETPHGLYVDREFVAHPRIRRWQAHLLPMHNLVVCRYDFHGRREHDYYLDVAQITHDGAVWSVRDLYLDIVLHDGLMAEIVDTDELLAAREAAFITEREMHRAVDVAHHTLASLARARYSLREWQAAQHLSLDWTPTPVATA
ncbi:hypothetical protein HNQ07_000966 [Deinococcus metalli]|uniref:DUF402 domain-containing protein n=1 Tax=Deinococcus metalli TaxID=1141878 RepID=A0A7W8KC82_9DEIO|nr:DUF402 domain-containing protein [Deinococcus metalli]MBB5375522.1 hypothetical protein [Deinococcus metalli]GHF28644.1 hypothetical protein GCM10017781_00740 [Deinococcus metalli]